MAKTEIHYFETPVDREGELPIVIEHPDDHQILICEGDYIGGGGDRRFLLKWVLIGPAGVKDIKVNGQAVRTSDGEA